MTITAPIRSPFITSAPGKVIIFGEHSVVYKKPAIAASTSSLRTYLLVRNSNAVDSTTGSHFVELNFPDIDFKHRWTRDQLAPIKPQHIVSTDSEGSPVTVNETLSEEHVTTVKPLLDNISDPIQYHAAFCFLYLLTNIVTDLSTQLTSNNSGNGSSSSIIFTLRSTLPVGAGLGSSAAISVCLAHALLNLNSPTQRVHDKRLINQWAFVGELCIHGNPSGIDNAIATYGGLIQFKKSEPLNFLERKEGTPRVDIMITNTHIPKSTKELVAGVKRWSEQYPEIISPVLEAMGNVALRGAKALQEGDVRALLRLVKINHGLLVSLGVSHPGLERVKALGDELGIGETKITGAGGGGCMLTVIRDTGDGLENVAAFKRRLHALDYETYETVLGGSGCCFCSLEDIDQVQLTEIFELFDRKDSVKRHEIDKLLRPDSDTGLSWVH